MDRRGAALGVAFIGLVTVGCGESLPTAPMSALARLDNPPTTTQPVASSPEPLSLIPNPESAPAPASIPLDEFVASITVVEVAMPAAFEPVTALPQPPGLGACPAPASTWPTRAVAQALRIIEEMATDETQRPSRRRSLVFFVIEEAGIVHGTHIAGELYRADGRPNRHGMAMFIHMSLIPGALRFANRTVFLEALRAGVTFDAEVRLTRRDLVPTCQPAGLMTGRIEGEF